MSFPIIHRTPNPYYRPSNHYVQNQNNFQWRPNMRPRMHYQKRNTYFTGAARVNNEEYWCETCDKGFPTAEYLEKHKQQHQTCNIDGCQFVAHPKVITKHIQMQHSSGLYHKIAKLNNPDEIKKWIEERKKRYPTKLNIDKKNAAVQEKIERGEKMGLRKEHWRNQLSGTEVGSKRKLNYKNDQNFKKQFKQNCFNKSKHHTANSNKPSEHKNVHLPVPTCGNRKLKPFAGIQSINMESDVEEEEEEVQNFNIEDDDDDDVEKSKNEDSNEPLVCGALSALICNYESSDEETKGVAEPEEKKNQKNPESIVKDDAPQKIVSHNEKHFDKIDNTEEDSGPEEAKIIKNDYNADDKQNETNSNRISNVVIKKKAGLDSFNRKRPFNRPKPKLPSTLLQKLLHKEMQHERNIVLQCIRYIVKNNYFDK